MVDWVWVRVRLKFCSHRTHHQSVSANHFLELSGKPYVASRKRCICATGTGDNATTTVPLFARSWEELPYPCWATVVQSCYWLDEYICPLLIMRLLGSIPNQHRPHCCKSCFAMTIYSRSQSRHKWIEIAKISPAITIYLRNAKTPPKPSVKHCRSNI